MLWAAIDAGLASEVGTRLSPPRVLHLILSAGAAREQVTVGVPAMEREMLFYYMRLG